MKAKELQKLLKCSGVSVKHGIYTARVGFYWPRRELFTALKNRVASIPNVEILDSGEKFVAFNGGHSLSQGSHWWVKFKLNPIPPRQE